MVNFHLIRFEKLLTVLKYFYKIENLEQFARKLLCQTCEINTFCQMNRKTLCSPGNH